MTMATKTEIFSAYLKRYLDADKNGKGAILTHVCFVTRLHRKAAIRKFRKLQIKDSAHQEQRGRRISNIRSQSLPDPGKRSRPGTARLIRSYTRTALPETPYTRSITPMRRHCW